MLNVLKTCLVFLFASLLIASSAQVAQSAVAQANPSTAQVAQSAVAPARSDLLNFEVHNPFATGSQAANRKAANRVRLDAETLPTQCLLVVTLEQAIGSNDIGLDRAQNSEPMLISFKRYGDRVLLIQENTRFVAKSADASEAQAAVDAFASAVLWAGDVEYENGRAWLDVSSLLTEDWVGVSDRLRALAQGEYRLDPARSMALPEDAKSFPNNAEMAALLTFSGQPQGEFVRQAQANPNVLTVKQRLSFVRLPEKGFDSRAYHPQSGGYSSSYFDFSQAIERNLEVRLQARFRLQKIDPSAARSRVVKPIIFYLDRGTPEPIRGALLEGANWWQAAFESAGFIDAFRAELAPADIDMADVRYNTITWTHRATRGWSYGMGLIDPRSGEIIKGAVNLGSQRVRQDLLIAEGLLAAYQDREDISATELQVEAKAMALQRLKQLAAHEVAHALGFAHNFAASRAANGSVVDYPHPVIELDQQGLPRLQAPYGNALGDWDHYLVANIYGEFAAGTVEQKRAELRDGIFAKGYRYVSDGDARVAGDAHPEGVLWDVPGEPFSGLAHLLKVRKIALERFVAGALPPDRQVGDLERRLVPIYLLHRYQTEAVARMLGGRSYQYGLLGESAAGSSIVDAQTQMLALKQLRSLLSVEVLAMPDSVLSSLTPPSNDYARGVEYFSSTLTPLFDPGAAVASATGLVTQLAFAPERLNRLNADELSDAPSVAMVFEQLVMQSWQEKPSQNAPNLQGSRRIIEARNWTILDQALWLAHSGRLNAPTHSIWRESLQQFVEQFSDSKDLQQRQAALWVERFLENPDSIKLRPPASIPPGAPI